MGGRYLYRNGESIMTAIRIEVEPEVAKAFQSANKIDRQKLQLLVNGWLK